MHDIVFGRGSTAPARLRGGSVAPEMLRNTGLYHDLSEGNKKRKENLRTFGLQKESNLGFPVWKAGM